MILLDDECKPDKGVANVNRFIHQHKVHLVLGSTCSSVSMPMVDITAKEEVPQIIPHSTNSSITQKGSEWVFRVSVAERFYAAVHAKYLAENVGKKVAYLYTTDGAAISFAKDYTTYMKTTYNVDPVYSDADAGDRPRFPLAPAEDQVAQSGRAGDRRPARCDRAHRPAVVRGRHSAKVRRVAASAASNAPVPELAGDAAIGLTFAAAFTCKDERPDRAGIRDDGAAEVQRSLPRPRLLAGL